MSEQRRLTVKGQVTIPKDVRDELGLRPGALVEFEREGKRVYLRKGADADSRRQDFKARLDRALRLHPPLPMECSTDEYMAMIREPVPLPGRE